MFSKEWLLESEELLAQAFKNYIPRSQYLTNKKIDSKTLAGEGFNFCGFHNLGKPLFTDLWKDNSQFDKLSKVFFSLFFQTSKSMNATSFITFSYGYNNLFRCPSHLHNFIDARPCRTTTYGITLYDVGKPPSFYVSNESKKWNSRLYLQPERLPTDIVYNENILDSSTVMKVEFNSSFHPHYITYTENVVAWLVIDGSLHEEDFKITTLSLNSI